MVAAVVSLFFFLSSLVVCFIVPIGRGMSELYNLLSLLSLQFLFLLLQSVYSKAVSCLEGLWLSRLDVLSHLQGYWLYSSEEVGGGRTS